MVPVHGLAGVLPRKITTLYSEPHLIRNLGRDLELAFDVAMRIEASTVWINEHMAIDPSVTARGAKFSGLGGELGPEGFNSYTQSYILAQSKITPARV